MVRFYRDEGIIKRVGTNVKILLKIKKITHNNFQDDTGLSTSRITSGEMNMTISTLQKIADYLEVSIEDLTEEQ